MLIEKEESENIISYVDYSKIFHVIRSFPDLNQIFSKGNMFPSIVEFKSN